MASSYYRISRNIEASIIDYLKEQINLAWTGVSVEKSFVRIYKISLPSVCIRCRNTAHDPVELGSNATKRSPIVLIDLFCANDGQRLDLKDYIISKIKSGIPYYEYEIEAGVVKNKLETGRIRVRIEDDNPINFDTDRNELDVHDRHRHLITLTVSTGKVEN